MFGVHFKFNFSHIVERNLTTFINYSFLIFSVMWYNILKLHAWRDVIVETDLFIAGFALWWYHHWCLKCSLHWLVIWLFLVHLKLFFFMFLVRNKSLESQQFNGTFATFICFSILICYIMWFHVIRLTVFQHVKCDSDFLVAFSAFIFHFHWHTSRWHCLVICLFLLHLK